MKNRYLIIILTIILFSVSFHSYSQRKIRFSGGIGFPEYSNLGIHLKLHKKQFGLTVSPILQEGFPVSASIEGRFYIDKFSKGYNVPVWYNSFELHYLQFTDIETDRYIYLNYRIGKDIYFTKRIGICLAIGLAVKVYEDKTSYSKWEEFNPYHYPIMLSPGIRFFLN